MSVESIVENRKFYKRNKILNLIRTGDECSVYDIKKLTAYSMATVHALVTELTESGMIRMKKGDARGKGRRPSLLSINPDYGYFIGLEFHATQINCCAINFLGEIVCSDALPIDPGEGHEDVLKKIFRLLDASVERCGRPPLGIGMGVPGYFDAEKGVAIAYPPIPGWVNIPVRELVESRMRVPCYIENNVASMATGYRQNYMSGRGGSLLFVSIRTGIRLVSIISNERYLCSSGYDGQLGHVRVPGGSRMCLCGRRGCLNTEASDTGLRLKLLEDIAMNRQRRLWEAAGRDTARVSTALFVDAVLEGDADALQLLNETAAYLGQALGTIIDIIAPEQLVIYGELARCGEALGAPLEEIIRESSMPDNHRRLKTSLCAPDERIGALGAAQIAMQKQYAYLEETV